MGFWTYDLFKIKITCFLRRLTLPHCFVIRDGLQEFCNNIILWNVMREFEFFTNSSTLLIWIAGIYQPLETQSKLAKWNCSQQQFKMEYKIEHENIKNPKQLPSFVSVAIEERLYIQQPWGVKEMRGYEFVYNSREERIFLCRTM